MKAWRLSFCATTFLEDKRNKKIGDRKDDRCYTFDVGHYDYRYFGLSSIVRLGWLCAEEMEAQEEKKGIKE